MQKLFVIDETFNGKFKINILDNGLAMISIVLEHFTQFMNRESAELSKFSQYMRGQGPRP